MMHFWSLNGVELQHAWLTIGSFDGVHLGHQEIIRNMTAGAHAEGAPVVVVAFYPHPAVVLRKRQGATYLMTPEERAARLEELGVDVVISHPFNPEVAKLTARQFMELMAAHLGMSRLYAGHDFALGRGREGNIDRLRELGRELGYTVHEFEQITWRGEIISSSLIRNALAEGEVESALRYQGRPFQISGEVVRGDARGRALGIPTANLAVWPEQVVPKAGVYVCHVQIGNETYRAVTNIGTRPTFEVEPVPARVEAHLLDFDRDLYGRQLRLSFLARLRDEQKFSNIEALVAQIHADIHQAREQLAMIERVHQ
jgi:riboflavin kinase/FMN adenylyltransferase